MPFNSALPKNTTQYLWKGLEPGPLASDVKCTTHEATVHPTQVLRGGGGGVAKDWCISLNGIPVSLFPVTSQEK